MPELPEVETVKNEISPYIIGRRITGVRVMWQKLVREPTEEEFIRRLAGQLITNVERRGKYLVISLASGDYWIIHLKMSGSLLVAPGTAEPPKYTQAIIDLDNGSRIFFRDPRKFGRMLLLKDRDRLFRALGPEPLLPGFTPDVLARLAADRDTPIKAVLIDQARIAGIGNMYADEALWEARIHPLRPARSLTRGEIIRLYDAIRNVLTDAIRHKGASIVNYYRPDGSPGTAHDHFHVAHRGGAACPRCGTPIQRIVVRGRGTYFCPRCQVLS